MGFMITLAQPQPANAASSDWVDNVTPSSWRHFPAGCRRYEQADCLLFVERYTR